MQINPWENFKIKTILQEITILTYLHHVPKLINYADNILKTTQYPKNPTTEERTTNSDACLHSSLDTGTFGD